MQKPIWFLAGVLALAMSSVAPSAFAAALPISAAPAKPFVFTASNLVMWQQQYYIRHDVQNVGAWIDFIDGRADRPELIPLPAAFLSVVMRDNPALIEGWQAHAVTPMGKAVFARALWQSGETGRLKAFDPDAFAALQGQADVFKTHKVTGAADQTALWGAFYASGDTTYLLPLIDVLGDAQAGIEVAPVFAGNMVIHERVVRLVRAQALTRTGPIKARLDNLLSLYTKDLVRLPSQAGDFSARMDSIAAADQAEFETPSDHHVQVHTLSDVKVGQAFVIKILFTGMALSNDLTAYVTYDMRITGPEGKSVMDDRGLRGFQGKLTSAHNLFDNAAVVGITFDAGDPAGTYKIDAVVHDTVGGKDIPLQGQIELKK